MRCGKDLQAWKVFQQRGNYPPLPRWVKVVLDLIDEQNDRLVLPAVGEFVVVQHLVQKPVYPEEGRLRSRAEKADVQWRLANLLRVGRPVFRPDVVEIGSIGRGDSQGAVDVDFIKTGQGLKIQVFNAETGDVVS